ncbi:hypothetical protein O9929_19485 [Vibrio lentus]|nr:hypothetical protein [Vibrio lentus]
MKASSKTLILRFDDGDLPIGLGLLHQLTVRTYQCPALDFTYNNEDEVLAYFSLGENIWFNPVPACSCLFTYLQHQTCRDSHRLC